MQYNKADVDTAPGAQRLVAQSDLSNFQHAEVTWFDLCSDSYGSDATAMFKVERA